MPWMNSDDNLWWCYGCNSFAKEDFRACDKLGGLKNCSTYIIHLHTQFLTFMSSFVDSCSQVIVSWKWVEKDWMPWIFNNTHPRHVLTDLTMWRDIHHHFSIGISVSGMKRLKCEQDEDNRVMQTIVTLHIIDWGDSMRLNPINFQFSTRLIFISQWNYPPPSSWLGKKITKLKTFPIEFPLSEKHNVRPEKTLRILVVGDVKVFWFAHLLRA